MSFRSSNASSGMGVNDHSIHTFLELKRKRVHRYIVFKIDEKKKEVVVEKTGGPAESYEDFASSLPENDCRYAIYDFDFVTEENCQKSKIFFIACYSSCSMRDFSSFFKYVLTILAVVVDCISFIIFSIFSLKWSPSASRIRAKMLYATSKDRFRQELDGIHKEIQATDPTEMDLDVLRDRAY